MHTIKDSINAVFSMLDFFTKQKNRKRAIENLEKYRNQRNSRQRLYRAKKKTKEEIIIDEETERLKAEAMEAKRLKAETKAAEEAKALRQQQWLERQMRIQARRNDPERKAKRREQSRRVVEELFKAGGIYATKSASGAVYAGTRQRQQGQDDNAKRWEDSVQFKAMHQLQGLDTRGFYDARAEAKASREDT